MTSETREHQFNGLTPFGEWFLQELKLRGWTQAEFARLSKTAPRRISDWLHRSTPDLESVAKISETLSIPIGIVAARALNRERVIAPAIAEEIAELAKSIHPKLLIPIAIALRSLQDQDIQRAALRELEG